MQPHCIDSSAITGKELLVPLTMLCTPFVVIIKSITKNYD